jgi:hypothetical protein
VLIVDSATNYHSAVVDTWYYNFFEFSKLSWYLKDNGNYSVTANLEPKCNWFTTTTNSLTVI